MTTPISYETFELLIGEPTDAGYSVRVLDSPHGQAKGLLQLDEDALAELIDALEVIEARETDIDTLAQIGDFLFDALFADDILLLYRQSLAVVHGQESRLRVRLHIEPPALAALPWEFLHDAETASFPAIAPETALMRFIPMKLPVRASAIEPPLRILAVIANPERRGPPGCGTGEAHLAGGVAAPDRRRAHPASGDRPGQDRGHQPGHAQLRTPHLPLCRPRPL